MATTGTKRIWYAQYACEKSGDFPEVTILGREREVCPLTVEAWQAFNQVLTLTGYDAQSVGTYNCRPITGGSKLSLHAYGIAVDIDPFALGNPYYGFWKSFSWNDTEFTPEQIAAVEAIRTTAGKKVFLWGGRWISIKDYMHFEIDVSPSDLEKGIDWSTVKGGQLVGGEPMLKKGDKGRAVAEAQHAMTNLWGYQMQPDGKDWPPFEQPEGTVAKSIYTGKEFGPGEDGSFGDHMEAMVSRFQRNVDLPRTGILDSLTMGMLMEGIYQIGGGGLTQTDADKRYVRRGINVTSRFS